MGLGIRFQLWENTLEGTTWSPWGGVPLSPACPSLEILAEWLAKQHTDINMPTHGPDKVEWLAILKEPHESPFEVRLQLWEDVRNTMDLSPYTGGPLSPSCPDAETLAGWLADQPHVWRGTDEFTKEDWLRFIDIGYAPSFMLCRGIGIVSGIQHVVAEDRIKNSDE